MGFLKPSTRNRSFPPKNRHKKKSSFHCVSPPPPTSSSSKVSVSFSSSRLSWGCRELTCSRSGTRYNGEMLAAMAKHNGTQRRQRIALGNAKHLTKFFPLFVGGKSLPSKILISLKSCQSAKNANSRVIGPSGAENCIGIFGDYQVTSTIGKKMSSTVAKLLPLMGSGFWVSICFVKTWGGYFSPWLCSSLPPNHWRRAFMAETFCGQAK